MLRKIATVSIIVAFAVALFWSTPAVAKKVQSGDMFYNYYGPVAMDGTTAPLYVSPRPVPEYVGHTYITYEPLKPHEFLYTHGRTYVRHNPGAGMTMTRVRYGHFPQPLMRCYPLGRGFSNFINMGKH